MGFFFCGPVWDFVFPPRSPNTGEDCPPGSPLIQVGSFCLWSLVGLSIILGLCPKGFKPSNSLFKGAIRAYGLSIATMAALPANSGQASDDALIRTLRAAFASSTYLRQQIPGLGRSSDDDFLNLPNS